MQENHWQGNSNIELELVGVRETPPSQGGASSDFVKLPQSQSSNKITVLNKKIETGNVQKAVFTYSGRIYVCSKTVKELRIRNERGNILAVSQGDRTGLLGKTRESAQEVNVTKEPYFQLIKAALRAIEAGK